MPPAGRGPTSKEVLSYPEGDREWESHGIDEVKGSVENGWTVCWDRGTSCIGFQSSFAPKVGDEIRLYGRGLGYPVRGIYVGGRKVYYRTPHEEEDYRRKEIEASQRKEREDFDREKASLDARFEALPEVFRRRIERFRSNNPEFRWKFEKYELFCCEQAVMIANTLKTTEAVKEFQTKEFSEQRAIVPNLSDEHSGNTFGMSVNLAYHYLHNEDVVPHLHGALVALVGCDEYGCPPPKLSAEEMERMSKPKPKASDIDLVVEGIRSRAKK